jgi:hypothetical protein
MHSQSKETPFVVRRWDRDITILPQKNLNDIRAIPNTKLNAQIINIFVRDFNLLS